VGAQLFASLVDGLLLGFVYGMAAMGLNLIWGVMRVINLAHGALMVLGMFGAYAAHGATGLSPYAAIPVLAVAGCLLGMGVYWSSVHRLIRAPHLSSLLATFAINMILIGVGTALFTTSPRNIDYSIGAVRVGSFSIQGTRLAAAATAMGLSAGLNYFLKSTFLGKCIRAVADNQAAAELMGISSSRVLAVSFGLGTMLAVASGALIATVFPFNVLSGGTYETKAFVICVLGGLGDPKGALVGGLLLGAIEGIIPVFLPVRLVPLLEFGLFVGVLLVRPSGLFGGGQ
jgi:branched-chain amino acid transport system permease protein